MSSFIYDSTDTLNITINDGTIGSGASETFSDSGSLTGEENAFDLSLSTEVTAINGGDCIWVDFGEAKSIYDIAFYNTEYDGSTASFIVFSSTDGTNFTRIVNPSGFTDTGWHTIDVGTPTARRYWCFRFGGSFTTWNTGQIILGTKLDWEVEPNKGIKIGEKFANDISESLGGIEYSNKRHDSKTFWEMNWDYISSTFKENLVSFRDAIEGDYKKFVYYDDSDYHWVRMSADSMKMTEVAHNIYNTSLNMVEQLS